MNKTNQLVPILIRGKHADSLGTLCQRWFDDLSVEQTETYFGTPDKSSVNRGIMDKFVTIEMPLMPHFDMLEKAKSLFKDCWNDVFIGFEREFTNHNKGKENETVFFRSINNDFVVRLSRVKFGMPFDIGMHFPDDMVTPEVMYSIERLDDFVNVMQAYRSQFELGAAENYGYVRQADLPDTMEVRERHGFLLSLSNRNNYLTEHPQDMQEARTAVTSDIEEAHVFDEEKAIELLRGLRTCGENPKLYISSELVREIDVERFLHERRPENVDPSLN